MERISPEFADQLLDMELSTLEHDVNAVFGLNANLELCYFNPAWLRFAVLNGGEPDLSANYGLGSFIGDAISGPLKEFYVRAYKDVLAADTPWDHDYECSSPDVYRRFHQCAFPLGRGTGIVVINALVVERPHDPVTLQPMPPDETLYKNEHGFYIQCSHCRRFQRPATPERWDWVPDWAAKFPRGTSHGLCLPCFDFYYRQRRKTG